RARPYRRAHHLHDLVGRQAALPHRRPHAPSGPADGEAADRVRLRHRPETIGADAGENAQHAGDKPHPGPRLSLRLARHRSCGEAGRRVPVLPGADEYGAVNAPVIPGPSEARSPESISTIGAISLGLWLWIPALALRAAAGMTWAYSAASCCGAGFIQRSTGARAARVSSRRRRGAQSGAPETRTVSPRFASIARSRSSEMQRSSEALLSDSVGSIS